MACVAVLRINNPKSVNCGKWYVAVEKEKGRPLQMVFMDKSKKVCVEYAKTLDEKPIVSNGVEYGAKF